jgi:hypothetical protein
MDRQAEQEGSLIAAVQRRVRDDGVADGHHHQQRDKEERKQVVKHDVSDSPERSQERERVQEHGEHQQPEERHQAHHYRHAQLGLAEELFGCVPQHP